MQIYYKISTYMSKLVAIEACRISQEKGITILDVALEYGKIPAGTQKSVKAIQTHKKRLLEEDGRKVIYRIIHFMGYQDYLEKANIKDSKLSIIQAIVYNEPSALALINRLYYVGVTRAKNELCIFEFYEGLTFTNELLGIENKKSTKLNNIYAGTNVSSSGNR